MEIIILFGVVLSATAGIILCWVLHELIAVRKELRAGILEFAAASRIQIARTAIRIVEPGFKATLRDLYLFYWRKDIDPSALFPIRVILSHVSLVNPSGFPEGEAFGIEQVEITSTALNLRADPPVVCKITAKGIGVGLTLDPSAFNSPDALLQCLDSGRNNLAKLAEPVDAEVPTLLVREVEFAGGLVNLRGLKERSLLPEELRRRLPETLPVPGFVTRVPCSASRYPFSELRRDVLSVHLFSIREKLAQIISGESEPDHGSAAEERMCKCYFCGIEIDSPGFCSNCDQKLPDEVKKRVRYFGPIEEWDQEFTQELKMANRQCFSELYATVHAFAETKHRGQFRDGGKPYITHPEAVAATFDDGPEKITAILHDVLEDTDATAEEIRAMVTAGGIKPEPFMEALRLMTHAPEMPYMEYIKAIAENPIARRVKLADLKHNMSTLDELPEPCRGLLKSRYVEALEYLNRI